MRKSPNREANREGPQGLLIEEGGSYDYVTLKTFLYVRNTLKKKFRCRTQFILDCSVVSLAASLLYGSAFAEKKATTMTNRSRMYLARACFTNRKNKN